MSVYTPNLETEKKSPDAAMINSITNTNANCPISIAVLNKNKANGILLH